MPASLAKLAHNLPRERRDAISLSAVKGSEKSWHDALPGAAIDTESVECSACHIEHRGADANMLAISDTQCQTCHQDRFGSFAPSHPEFDQWPYGRGQQIAFNHASHAGRHFPATIQGGQSVAFQCLDCHQPTENDELTRTIDYRRACAACHDASLQAQTAEGIELLTLPSLPGRSAQRVQPWPTWGTGFFDGKIAPLAELLLRKDPRVGSSFHLIPDRDFARVNAERAEMVDAAEAIARAHRRLLQEIAVDGQQVILDRAAAYGVQPRTLLPLVQSLPPQLIGEATRIWFGQDAEPTARLELPEVERSPSIAQVLFQSDADSLLPSDTSQDLLGDDLLGDDLLGDDLLGDDLLGDD